MAKRLVRARFFREPLREVAAALGVALACAQGGCTSDSAPSSSVRALDDAPRGPESAGGATDLAGSDGDGDGDPVDGTRATGEAGDDGAREGGAVDPVDTPLVDAEESAAGGDLPQDTAGDDSDDATADDGTPDDGTPDETNMAPDPVDLRLPVGPVWSGHPVNFALVTRDDRQFVAFYDPNRALTVGARRLTSSDWQLVRLPTTLGWDSHNHIAMAVDSGGYLHVSANMHNVPLIYFRSAQPLDVTSFERVAAMVGPNEQSVTYPEFFHGPGGELVFIHRDGGSGNGSRIFNVYDVPSRSWRRLLDTPLTDGQGARSAYPVGPVQGPDGNWHLVWVWRDTPDAASNHDLSYARSTDLVNWQTGSGQALTLPVTLAESDVVDPVPSGGGMINNNTHVGFDAQGRPVVAYHKYDANGATQLYNARLEGGAWISHQTSSWDYRWDFGGEGTLVFEVEVQPVEAQPDGSLTQRFYHAQYGGWGAFRLDPETLAAEAVIDPPLPYPASLDVPESATAGMVVRWQEDSGVAPNDDVSYLLRWETLESNRDEPRDVIPPPTELRLYGFRR